MKRVLIDARFLNPSISGLSRYTRELLNHFAELAPEDWLFLPLTFKEDSEFFSSFPKGKFEPIIVSEKWYSFSEQISLRRKIYAATPDIVHFFSDSHPFLLKLPYLLTIHDLTKFSYSQTFSACLKRPFFRLVFIEGLKNSRKIIAISENTRKELLRKFAVDANKIEVIYNGLSLSGKRDFSRRDVEEVFVRFKIKKPFLLYVGQVRVHKNIPRLIEAFSELKRLKGGENYQLVIAGRINPPKEELYNMLKTSPEKDSILLTDFVDEKTLTILYSEASIFVFPSLSEGFGLPPLEALSYSLPVAVSDLPIMHEILGEAAFYFNPLKPKEIARVLHSLIKDEESRRRLKGKAKERIKKFSWKTAAQNTLDLYKKILG